MASILDVSVSSDSEDDVDYVPTGEIAASESSADEDISEDDLASDEPKLAKKKKGAKQQKKEAKKQKKDNEKDLSTETSSNELTVDPKKHADDIWKSFLEDVDSAAVTKSKITIDVSAEIQKSANHIPVESESKDSKVPEAKVFEFAGETFTVDDELNPPSHDSSVSKANDEDLKKESQPKKRGGIGSVLGTLMNKKQKMTTLQKTLYDWKSFKKAEGIEEDLEKFNKGRGGFIERQRFLQRSDVRSFEAEKSIRQSKKKK